jgi:hypothetical protein
MSFQTGLSGLNSAARDLDVVGNNVANANVTGFKGSRAQFAEVMATSLNGGGSNSIGIGTKIATVAQDFTQGTISVTNTGVVAAVHTAGAGPRPLRVVDTMSNDELFVSASAGWTIEKLTTADHIASRRWSSAALVATARVRRARRTSPRRPITPSAVARRGDRGSATPSVVRTSRITRMPSA